MNTSNSTEKEIQEKIIIPKKAIFMVVLLPILFIVSIAIFIFTMIQFDSAIAPNEIAVAVISLITSLIMFAVSCILCAGFRVINPNEALVLTLFGNYYGTITQHGFFYVNPFCTGVNPSKPQSNVISTDKLTPAQIKSLTGTKKISLKAMTLNNEKQKVNDLDGNPIEIGVIVIWKITNPTKAVFHVDDYVSYISTQCDSAIREVARSYPYDVSTQGDEQSLRGSSSEVAQILKEELQSRTQIAGIEITDARISHLAYAPEIAAAMLQRQQAAAIICARQLIVEGAVGMVEMAINQLSEKSVLVLDDERKAQIVSNLLVVLCGNKDAQPIVNSGSIY